MVDLKLAKSNLYNVECKIVFSVKQAGLTLETSAFKLFTVANLRFQLSW